MIKTSLWNIVIVRLYGGVGCCYLDASGCGVPPGTAHPPHTHVFEKYFILNKNDKWSKAASRMLSLEFFFFNVKNLVD